MQDRNKTSERTNADLFSNFKLVPENHRLDGRFHPHVVLPSQHRLRVAPLVVRDFLTEQAQGNIFDEDRDERNDQNLSPCGKRVRVANNTT